MPTTGVRGFEDPIAAKTQWTPLVPGRARSGPNTLFVGDGSWAQRDSTRLEFRYGPEAKFYAGFFLVVGLVGTVASLLVKELLLFGFLAAFPCFAAGLYLAFLLSMRKNLLFDGAARVFTTPRRRVPFSAIHALQIIKEYVVSVSDDEVDGWSYELNLVLTSGERVNLVDHGDLDRVRADAKKISDLLGCKLWDAGS